MNMEYKAVTKNVKIAPRKVRLVADSIKKLSLPQAVSQLVVLPQRAALPLKKTLDSAAANAVHNDSAQKDNLKIKSINITEGLAYKRYHFAGRGRMRPYVKRTSHIHVVLEDVAVKAVPAVTSEVIKKENTKTVEKTKGGKK